ncbi:metallophosphoesterase, partial [Paraburkholderia sediminicola]|uniref:metallophosphoesterase n=1 Tax=Paraburkholderia sediminicola TaxID=458836 RepID=UPI0038BD0DE2
MRIQIASDLHLEWGGGRALSLQHCVDDVDADVLVLAGDINRIRDIAKNCASWPGPIVYVHGNHDMYGREYYEAIAEARRTFAGTQIHYLESNEWICGKIRFLGCCLWTDYAAAGPRGQALEVAAAHTRDAPMYVDDRGNLVRFSPWDALHEHQNATRWLEGRLLKPFPGKTVVVTHHAPHSLSLSTKRRPSYSDATYASNLPRLLRWSDVWIHGHIHKSVDYRYS